LWRLRTGWALWLGLVVGALLFGAVGWLVWHVTAHRDPSNAVKAAAVVLGSIGTILGVGSTLWALTRGVQDWMLVHSAAGARSGLSKGSDPLALVKDRFEQVVRALGLPLGVV